MYFPMHKLPFLIHKKFQTLFICFLLRTVVLFGTIMTITRKLTLIKDIPIINTNNRLRCVIVVHTSCRVNTENNYAKKHQYFEAVVNAVLLLLKVC